MGGIPAPEMSRSTHLPDAGGQAHERGARQDCIPCRRSPANRCEPDTTSFLVAAIAFVALASVVFSRGGC
jgi:hypothetical protein